MRFQILFYLAALAGIIVHFFVRWRDSQTKNEVFNWKQNLLFSLYVFVVTMAIVTFRGEIVGVLSKTGLDISEFANGYLIWFFVGYFGDSVWKNIENASTVILKQNVPTIPPPGPSVNP